MAGATVENQVAASVRQASEREPGRGAHRSPDNMSNDVLFTRWQRYGDASAREQLVARFFPLSRRLARRYRNTSESYEDLHQVALLGLVKAIDGYDPDRGVQFTGYAVPTILGELRRHFRNSSWAVHVPRTAQERALAVRDAERALTDEYARSPTIPEIAQFMELSIEQVLDGMQALRALSSMSLDAPRNRDAEGEERSFADSIGAEDPRFELVELDVDVASALRLLKPRQREILRLRFVEELSQGGIGKRIGVSQMQVSRLLAATIAELRELTGAAVGHSHG
jgi:RNA polymerase sigma-B factor